MARVNMGASLPAINQTRAEANAPASLNGAAAGGAKKPIGWGALRALHKGVCARYDELAKLCHGNTFSIAFLVDQLEHSHGPAGA